MVSVQSGLIPCDASVDSGLRGNNRTHSEYCGNHSSVVSKWAGNKPACTMSRS